MNKRLFCQFILFFILISFGTAYSQQRADNINIPEIKNPRFKNEKGPKVYIDQGHNNFHQKTGRFKPFSDLIKKDGYNVDSITDLKKIKKGDILVIANAVNESNRRNWRRPIEQAFSKDEVLFLKEWVKKGGKLLLIADHMPFAGASNSLANAFGFNFCDGFAYLIKDNRNNPDVFSIKNKRMLDSEIINGKFGVKIDYITTFTGSSFSIPKEAKGILKFKKGDYCLAPEIAWQFTETTERLELENKYQGSILNFGKGKVAVFGEAAMFTAQTITNNIGTFKFGFHSENAPNNLEFIRNLMYWLSIK